MSISSDDFARGCAAGYRAALVSCWRQLEGLEPGQRDAFAKAFLAGLEREVVASLHSPLASNEFVSGLHSVEDALQLLVREAEARAA